MIIMHVRTHREVGLQLIAMDTETRTMCLYAFLQKWGYYVFVYDVRTSYINNSHIIMKDMVNI